MNQFMQSYHVKLYIPIILLWGSAILSSLDPVLVQSDIRFDPLIERGDLLRIDPGGDIALDDIVIYRLSWTDYVAQVIGLPGQEIMLGLDGRSIIRDGERIALAPPGFRISTNASGILSVEEGQAAVYVHNVRRNPVSVVIGQDAIRGPVEKIYRYAELGRAEWLTIGFYSLIVLTLIVLPYAAFVRQQSPSLFRIVVLVVHTFLTLAVAGALLAASLPGDPMQIGATEPIWWWFPLAVVNGFDIELVLVVGLFLGGQWLIVNQPWQRGENDRTEVQ
jgi:hypothetical protein